MDRGRYSIDSAISTGTIRKLHHMFSTHGISETIVSDNGSVFTSKEFQQFTKLNGIKHMTTVPYQSRVGKVTFYILLFVKVMRYSYILAT